MTNEEAIKDIKENILPIVGGKSLLMAIAALEGKDTNIPTNDGKTLVVKIPKEYLDTTSRVILDSDPWCKLFYEDSAPTALDHIHNVVAENERKRGYEQAKEEYDHKLTEIKSRIKDHYYNKGYEQGKADAAPKWIPFTADTMPKEDGLYIIKYKTKTGGKAISADSYSTAYGEWFINHNDAVIAWMPAPKEEGEQHDCVH